MKVIEARNVNGLYRLGREYLMDYGEYSVSRAGDVVVARNPVMSVYNRPEERVLFDEARDANPFFHLFESLWMLAGEQDARWLDRFVHDFSARFAEPIDGQMWGAYGHRWRNHFEFDQLRSVVTKLRKNPGDRQVVIAMWDPHFDLWDDEKDEGHTLPKDIPCNTHVMPRVVNGKLDITVCCRSNDIIFGAYGANAVHFSVLQEYLAAGIGVGVGRMFQLSNNFHQYEDVAGRMKLTGLATDHYATGLVKPLPMIMDFAMFDDDLDDFMTYAETNESPKHGYENPWFEDVAIPMWKSHMAWKRKDQLRAEGCAEQIAAGDWRLAAQMWLRRHAR